ncbi:hypothetical protein MHBO_000176 [Bonamia ostreae]|uniref:K Homology domain-containing protein n=1 Tax=Bonamia ostreae TaxID=126728 RepID=A0ABV2AEN9_9EUKA
MVDNDSNGQKSDNTKKVDIAIVSDKIDPETEKDQNQKEKTIQFQKSTNKRKKPLIDDSIQTNKKLAFESSTPTLSGLKTSEQNSNNESLKIDKSNNNEHKNNNEPDEKNQNKNSIDLTDSNKYVEELESEYRSIQTEQENIPDDVAKISAYLNNENLIEDVNKIQSQNLVQENPVLAQNKSLNFDQNNETMAYQQGPFDQQPYFQNQSNFQSVQNQQNFPQNQLGMQETPNNYQISGNAQNNVFNSMDQFEALIEQCGPDEFKAEMEVPSQIKNEPTLNFVGMMIGPGGYTQKQMEKSSGCSITVRGSGSARHNTPLDSHRPMYVLVKSNHVANVRTGIAIVSELLNDKSKRDALRAQQMAMRNANLNNSAQNYANPAFYMRQVGQMNGPPSFPAMSQQTMSSNRSPFQNAFKVSYLGDGQIVESIIIPAAKAVLLSENNNAICEEVGYYSSVRIEIKDVPGNQTLMELILQGTKEQVSIARTKLQAYMDNDPNELPQDSSDFVMIPNTVVGLLIGKNGETIKKFMSDTSCKIKVVPEYLSNPEKAERKILLEGNTNQVANAKFVINDLVNKHKTSNYTTANTGQTRVEVVSIPCGCIGILIGKGGETIRALGQRTSCRVQVVQYDENQLFPGGVIQNQNLRHVSLRGDETSLKKAKIEIQAIINEHAHRNNYEAPRLENDFGDPHLGLTEDQYQKYLDQMKAHFNMEKDQVHEYYHRVMSEIAREPAEYAAQVRQYMQQTVQQPAPQWGGTQWGQQPYGQQW